MLHPDVVFSDLRLCLEFKVQQRRKRHQMFDCERTQGDIFPAKMLQKYEAGSSVAVPEGPSKLFQRLYFQRKYVVVVLLGEVTPVFSKTNGNYLKFYPQNAPRTSCTRLCTQACAPRPLLSTRVLPRLRPEKACSVSL